MAVSDLFYITIFLKGENLIMIDLVRNKLGFNFILQKIVSEQNCGKYLSTYLVSRYMCVYMFVCLTVF